MLIPLRNSHRLPFSPASEYWALQALWGQGEGRCWGQSAQVSCVGHQVLVHLNKQVNLQQWKLTLPWRMLHIVGEDSSQQTSSFWAVCKMGSLHSFFIKTTSTHINVDVVEKKSLSGWYNISTKIIKYTVKKFHCCFNNVKTAFIWNVVKYGFGQYNWCFYKE